MSKKTAHDEDRQLQIRLAKANAELQFNMAVGLGLLAAAIVVLVFIYQLVSESFPAFKIKKIFALLFAGLDAILIFYARKYLTRLDKTMKEIRSLR